MQPIVKHVLLTLKHLVWISVLAAGSAFTLASDRYQTLQIGAGGMLGNYFHSAFTLCNLINRDITTNHIACHARITAGSAENINGLRSGRFQLAIAQSDAVIAATNGATYFEDANPYDGLRLVQVLYPEVFTVLVRQDSSYSTFSDLRNKRVNAGDTESGIYLATQSIVNALNWSLRDKASFTNYLPSEQLAALCNNQIDAAVMVIGHPVEQLNDSLIGCPIRWIGFTDQDIETITQVSPFYTTVTVPEGIYSFDSPAKNTLGINAILVADSKTPDKLVFNIVTMIDQSLETMQQLAPVFNMTTRETLRPINQPGLPPLHNGALNFYQSTQ